MSTDKPAAKPTRDERVTEMRRAMKLLREQAGDDLEVDDRKENEFIVWAGVEHAAIDNLIGCAGHIISSLHPSLANDQDLTNTEIAMLLLQVAGVAAHRAEIPTDVLVKALLVFVTAAPRTAPPDEDEQRDFERLMYGGTN